MNRAARTFAPIFSLLLGLLAAPEAAGQKLAPVRISGVLFDGLRKGTPEPESSVRLTNADTKRRVNVGGFGITDQFTPQRGRAKAQIDGAGAFDKSAFNGGGRHKPAGAGKRARVVRLPEGTFIEPGGDLWLANEGRAFLEVFGFPPDFEAVDTLPQVPNLNASSGWVVMPAKHGTLALLNGFGEVVDFVGYDVDKEPTYTANDMLANSWKGPPVLLHQSTANTGWKGQILRRDRDEKGRLLPDTNTAADWDSGFSLKQLGEDPTHRVEYPGQTHFLAQRILGRARVLATSAPDNNFKALIQAIDAAKESIRLSVYQITNPRIVDALIRAKRRGVTVLLWLEGAPVGGIPDQERFLTDRLAKAGCQVHFLVSDAKHRVRARYRFDHSKYMIIDDKKVIIGTENYGRTGVPVVPSYGNRGWMVHIENPRLVAQLRRVWDSDYRPGAIGDVVGIDDDPNDKYGLPYRKPGFEPDETIQRGLYDHPKKPLLVEDKMGLELVYSPDTSLNEHSAIIGLINRAERELIIQQNSVRRRWGRKKDDASTHPDLPLQAVIAAARRGVKTRVLLDGTWYNVQGDDDRDNDDTVRYLTTLAQAEGLDLEAKVINLATTHLEKIHAKGVIVDGKEVFVGSINWSENSFKGNREIGVVVSHPKVAGYYRDLFWRDWSESRMYEVTTKRKAKLRSKPGGGKTLKRVKKGAKLAVVGELGGQDGKPAFIEVKLARGRTAYVAASAVGLPTASPQEALHLVGREAEIVGRVIATRVSPKVIQLRFADEKRPPFVAVIFRSSEPAFSQAGINVSRDFQGRVVRMRGEVKQWKSPEMILRGPKDISLFEGAARR